MRIVCIFSYFLFGDFAPSSTASSSRAVSGSLVWKGWVGLFPVSSPSPPLAPLAQVCLLPPLSCAGLEPPLLLENCFTLPSPPARLCPCCWGALCFVVDTCTFPTHHCKRRGMNLSGGSEPCHLSTQPPLTACFADSACGRGHRRVLGRGPLLLGMVDAVVGPHQPVLCPSSRLVRHPGGTSFPLLLQLCSSSWPLSASTGTTSILSPFLNLLSAAVVAEGANGPGSLGPPPDCAVVL